MNESTARFHERSLHLPNQAAPIRRDEWGCAEPASVVGGIDAAADCGSLTGMSRDLCYASQYGIYF